MVTKKKLRKENEELRNQLATMKIWLRSYIQSNRQLQDDIDVLNASLNCTEAEAERWRSIARKADERRLAYVRSNVSAD